MKKTIFKIGAIVICLLTLVGCAETKNNNKIFDKNIEQYITYCEMETPNFKPTKNDTEMEEYLYNLSKEIAEYFNNKYSLKLSVSKKPVYYDDMLDSAEISLTGNAAAAAYNALDKCYVINSNHKNKEIDSFWYVTLCHETIHMIFDENAKTAFSKFTYETESGILESLFTEGMTEKCNAEFLKYKGIDYNYIYSCYYPNVLICNMVDAVITGELNSLYLTGQFETVKNEFNEKFNENYSKKGSYEPFEYFLFCSSSVIANSLAYRNAAVYYVNTAEITQEYRILANTNRDVGMAAFETIFVAAKNEPANQKEILKENFEEFSKNVWCVLEDDPTLDIINLLD